MISTDNSHIRTTEPDDAPALYKLYNTRQPRAALLDHRREPMLPTCAELREMLGMKEAVNNVFFTLEEVAGCIGGFCVLRGMNHETGFGEIGLLFQDDHTLETPLAEEALAFACQRGFERLRLNKMVAHCLDIESALRQFLLNHGFISDGVQREVLYAQGRWHDIESLTLFRDSWAASRHIP